MKSWAADTKIDIYQQFYGAISILVGWWYVGIDTHIDVDIDTVNSVTLIVYTWCCYGRKDNDSGRHWKRQRRRYGQEYWYWHWNIAAVALTASTTATSIFSWQLISISVWTNFDTDIDIDRNNYSDWQRYWLIYRYRHQGIIRIDWYIDIDVDYYTNIDIEIYWLS